MALEEKSLATPALDYKNGLLIVMRVVVGCLKYILIIWHHHLRNYKLAVKLNNFIKTMLTSENNDKL